MNEYSYISDYRHENGYRQSFTRLAKQVFEIDFGQWYRDGYWNDQYVCHSFVHKDKVIANVSVNKLVWNLNGQRFPALQIGTVMTHPDYRKLGLAKSLMQKVLEQYRSEYDLMYLFAHKGVIDFYPQFGFHALPQYRTSIAIQLPRAVKNPVKISPTSVAGQKILDRYFVNTGSFHVEQSEHIQAFYRYNILNDCFYYDEKNDTVIVCQQQGPVLHLYGLMSSSPTDFTKLLLSLPQQDTTKVQFHFPPDLLNIIPKVQKAETRDVFYISGQVPANLPAFTYPIMTQA